MTYLQPRNRSLTHTRKRLQQGALIFVALFILSLMVTPLRGVVREGVASVWKGEQMFLSLLSPWGYVFSSKQALIEENESLKLELLQNRSAALARKALEEENAALKQFLLRERGTSVLAGIIARPPKTLYDTMIVDAGVREGVGIGQQVFAAPHIAIGEVVEVSQTTALISLYSSSGRETNVLIGDIAGVAIGRGAGNFMIQLPHDITVPTSSPITLFGSTLALLGESALVDASATAPEQTIYFQFPFSLASLRFVTILTDTEAVRDIPEWLVPQTGTTTTITLP